MTLLLQLCVRPRHGVQAHSLLIATASVLHSIALLKADYRPAFLEATEEEDIHPLALNGLEAELRNT
jgi:hypothetical protein